MKLSSYVILERASWNLPFFFRSECTATQRLTIDRCILAAYGFFLVAKFINFTGLLFFHEWHTVTQRIFVAIFSLSLKLKISKSFVTFGIINMVFQESFRNSAIVRFSHESVFKHTYSIIMRCIIIMVCVLWTVLEKA